MRRVFARPFLILMFGLVALLVPGSASAAEVRQGDTTFVAPGETIDDDLYVFGGTISIGGRVDRDVAVAAGKLDLAPGARIGHDLLAGVGTAFVAAPVARNVLIGSGDVTLTAPVGGDVRVEAGTLRLARGASVNGTVSYSSDNPAEIDSGVVVGGGIERSGLAYGRDLSAPLNDRAGVGPLIWLRGLVGILVLGLVLILLVPASTRRSTDFLSANLGWSLVVGTILLIGVPLLAALVFVVGLLIGGWWLGIALICLYALALGIGYVISAVLLGDLILERFFRREAHNAGSLLAGIVALGILAVLPVVGGIATSLAIAAGLGAAAWTAFNNSLAQRRITGARPMATPVATAPAAA